MADPLTQTLRLTQPTVGGDSGLWGGLLNSDMTYIDEGINQTIIVPVSDANFTLVADGTASDQARYQRYVITGAWTANRTITLPANLKLGRVVNSTSGGFDAIFTTGSGTALQVPSGGDLFFRCDGTNVFPGAGISNLGVRQVSAASQVTFSLSPSFRRFRIILQNVQVSSAGALLGMQTSTDGGATYVATNYAYAGNSSVATPPQNIAVGGFNTTFIVLSPQLGVGFNQCYALSFDIDPGSASVVPKMMGNGFGYDVNGSFQNFTFGGAPGTAGLINYCKVGPAPGTMSGLCTLLGMF